jgi:hypothetical protein
MIDFSDTTPGNRILLSECERVLELGPKLGTLGSAPNQTGFQNDLWCRTKREGRIRLIFVIGFQGAGAPYIYRVLVGDTL